MIRWRKNRIREREKITRSCIYGCLLMEKIYIGSLMIIFVFPSSRFITFDSQIKKNVHSLSSDGSHITAQWKLISRLYGFSRDEFALAMRKRHTRLRWWWWILNAKFHYLAVNDLEMRSWKLGWNQMKVDQVSNEIPWNTKGNDFSVKYQWQPVLSLSLYNPGVDVCKLTTREGIRQQLIYY